MVCPAPISCCALREGKSYYISVGSQLGGLELRLLCCVLCGTRFFLAEQMQKMLRRPCPNMMRCSTKGLTGRLPFAICIPGMAQVTRFYQHVATINRNLGEQEKPTETNRVAIRIWQICIQLQCLGAPTSYNSYRPLSPL